MDGDGSFDPAELPALLDDVRSGRADLAVGRRRPVSRGVWPWHARVGNRLVVQLLRRSGFPANDIAPIRVCRRSELLSLGVEDRRFGYPVELMRKATAGRVADRRAGRGLPPPRGRHPLEGVRLGPGHGPDCARLLEGPRDECTPLPGRRQGAGRRSRQDPPRRRGRHGGRRGPRSRCPARHPRDLSRDVRAGADARRADRRADAGRPWPRDRRPAARVVGVRAGRRHVRRPAGRRARRGRATYGCAHGADRDGHPAGHRGTAAGGRRRAGRARRRAGRRAGRRVVGARPARPGRRRGTQQTSPRRRRTPAHGRGRRCRGGGWALGTPRPCGTSTRSRTRRAVAAAAPGTRFAAAWSRVERWAS